MRMSVSMRERRRCLQRSATLLVTLGMLGAAATVAEPGPVLPAVPRAHFSLSQEALAQRALQVPVGGRFRLVGVPVEARTVALALERFEVFTPDARIEVHGLNGTRLAPLPRRAWFRGTVAGEPESMVFLAVGPGAVFGLINSRERLHTISTEEAPPSLHETLVVRALDESAVRKRFESWKCGLEKLPAGVPGGSGTMPSIFDESIQLLEAPASAQYSIKVSVETDYELYALFGSADATAAYIGDLFGAISTVYHTGLATTLRINYVSIWTGGAASDPWTMSTAGAALSQLVSWWGTNRPQVSYPRAITHFLSAKDLGGGVAYLGVLCNSSFGYGVSGNIEGSYPQPSYVAWDAMVVAHEIGHNFNSPHTHCYVPEVDRCYGGEGGGCYSGPASLPAGGKGSIMSYCHTLSGGMFNIALSLGTAGLYGTQSERVPQLMKNYVAARPLSCRGVVDAPPADFNGDGRSELFIYRNGAWLEFPAWPQK
jgi:hypothetical protein